MILRQPQSLFGKLLLGQLGIVLLAAIALPLFLSRMLTSTADGLITTRLEREATLSAQALARGDPVRAREDRLVALFDAGGRPIGAWPHPLPFAFDPRHHKQDSPFDRHGRYDVLSRPVTLPATGTGWIAVAQDRTRPEEIVDDIVHSFLGRFIWVIGAALLASFALSLLVLRRVTNTFHRAATDADRIGLHRLDARIDPVPMPREALPLVRATNRALDRLETGYRTQSEFIGNVAHELRTPLALIALRVEQLDSSPQREQIERGVEQANHVIRQLMELAAIDRLHPELKRVDSCRIAREAVEAMVPIVYSAGHSIAFEEPDAAPPRVQAVAELLSIALTNLIDNAVRHTPAGCTITVSVGPDGSVTVEDDGPGLAVDARDPAVRRFRRNDTARSDSAGLGLSIVERIMSVCGGGLETGQSVAGGALLRLRLDATPARSDL